MSDCWRLLVLKQADSYSSKFHEEEWTFFILMYSNVHTGLKSASSKILLTETVFLSV